MTDEKKSQEGNSTGKKKDRLVLGLWLYKTNQGDRKSDKGSAKGGVRREETGIRKVLKKRQTVGGPG